ncbi:MAG: hypothetical protein ABSC42_00600 [Tepidisphaeraceae bacterium]|jgi:hypothetical protein
MLGVLALIPIRIGRVRGSGIASVVGTLLGLLALYVIWLTWVHEVLDTWGFRVSYHALIVHPTVTFHLIRTINDVGTWKFHGEVARGFGLLIFWIGEAGIILAGSVVFSILGLYSGDPTCSKCGSRCKRIPNLPRFAVDRQDEFLSAIENRDFSSLTTHTAAKHQDDPELSLRLVSCPGCRKMHVLTVNRIAWHVDSNRRPTVKTVALIDQLLITPDEAEELKAVCAKIREQREAKTSPPPTTT